MAKSTPITGPYPDGDSRNLTLTKSDNPIEPTRTGPLEEQFVETPDAQHDASDEAASSEASDSDANARAPRYEEPSTTPSAAETAFGRPGGELKEPVLQEDWNPAERNSDDLSR